MQYFTLTASFMAAPYYTTEKEITILSPSVPPLGMAKAKQEGIIVYLT